MKIISLFVFLVLVPIFHIENRSHEYYVSVTNIEYVEKEQSLQIITQIFIDDLEKLLKERYSENLTLAPDSDENMVNSYIQRYLSDKLKIKINEALLEYSFLGKEYRDDIVYLYLEINPISDLNSIEVTNKVLFDIYEEQQNIVRLKINNRNKSFLLVSDNDKCMLNFD